MATREWVADRITIFNERRPLTRFVFEPGEFAQLRNQVEVTRCYSCDKTIVGKRVMHTDIYYPFEDTPKTFTFCEPCSDKGEGRFESSFYCEGCERDVWESNGHRLNYKFIGDCTMLCVRCFQEDMLENGHSDDAIEGRTIPCDFYDYTELASKGWEEGERFSGSMLERSGGEEWRQYCRDIKARGGLVLTDQGRTSIVGGPDYVTVYVKWPADVEAS